MTKVEIAKKISDHMTNFAIGSATTNIIRNNIGRSNSPVLNIIIDVSALIASIAAADVISEPLREANHRQIDQIVDAFANAKNA